MKKYLPIILVYFIILQLVAVCVTSGKIKDAYVLRPKLQVESDNILAIRKVVLTFGKRLKMVSIMSEKEILIRSIKEVSSDLVTSTLLDKWIKTPTTFPGRLVSSPWPDRIEILKIIKKSDTKYEVNGKIIEITSNEVIKGGIAAERNIVLQLKKQGLRWLIDAIKLGPYSDIVRDLAL